MNISASGARMVCFLMLLLSGQRSELRLFSMPSMVLSILAKREYAVREFGSVIEGGSQPFNRKSYTTLILIGSSVLFSNSAGQAPRLMIWSEVWARRCELSLPSVSLYCALPWKVTERACMRSFLRPRGGIVMRMLPDKLYCELVAVSNRILYKNISHPPSPSGAIHADAVGVWEQAQFWIHLVVASDGSDKKR